ncbi:MAG TPA: methylmalonyl Co-A mutase-associated GTPase MeaB [Burkholderiales bacterium]|nr:methylmalonyl Co-A mutase-associated GTPase MeaB [Burkholderiales bacterium]
MGRRVPALAASLELLERVRNGDRVALGRLITRAERGGEEVRTALAQAYRTAGRAHVVGITGVPGSGKSTLVGGLVQEARKDGRKVAIIAIDPSSPYSGGAILGDRIRMGQLALDPGVFIRSMATRGSTGGLAAATLAVADVMEAGAFDVIVIETVGVGQDEVEIVRASHTTVVVSAPGLGDDVQAIKAGILEIADIHVVSKCDRADAARTLADLKAMLALASATEGPVAWKVPVLATSAQTREGVRELLSAIDAHRDALRASELGPERARRIAEYRALKTAEDLLRARFASARSAGLAEMVDRISRRELDPFTAAETLLNNATF